jgi:hypothetical protein
MRNWDTWDWKTHQPLIRAAMDLYKPKFVLELGAGDHSTPLFLDYDIDFFSIENDLEWVNYMKAKYPKLRIIYHPLDDNVTIATRLFQLTPVQKARIYHYYEDLKLPEMKPNLLFIDQWTCNRTMSINALKDRFDIIIYHDCQPPGGIEEYEYNLINFTGFNVYFLRNCINWTGIMIRKEVDKTFEQLQIAMVPHLHDFIARFPEGGATMQLTRC